MNKASWKEIADKYFRIQSRPKKLCEEVAKHNREYTEMRRRIEELEEAKRNREFDD